MIVEFWIGTVTNRVPSAYRYFWHRYCRHTDTIPCCRVRASAGAASYRAQHQAPPRVWGQQGRERWQRGQAEAHRHQAPGRGLQQPEVWQRWALNTNNKNVDISFCQVFVRHYYFLHPIQSSHDVGNCRIWKKRVSWKLILGCLDVETGENNNNKAWDQRQWGRDGDTWHLSFSQTWCVTILWTHQFRNSLQMFKLDVLIKIKHYLFSNLYEKLPKTHRSSANLQVWAWTAGTR